MNKYIVFCKCPIELGQCGDRRCDFRTVCKFYFELLLEAFCSDLIVFIREVLYLFWYRPALGFLLCTAYDALDGLKGLIAAKLQSYLDMLDVLALAHSLKRWVTFLAWFDLPDMSAR